MFRPAWLVGLILLALPACSRPLTRDEAAERAVGTWHYVRENGVLKELPTGHSGLLQFGADGTISYEVVVVSTGPVKVKPAVGRYRFLDPETVEIAGENGGLVKPGAVRAVFVGERLTLQNAQGPVLEFERVK